MVLTVPQGSAQLSEPTSSRRGRSGRRDVEWIRPEWLFELAAALQAKIAEFDEAAFLADFVSESFLEQDILTEWLACSRLTSARLSALSNACNGPAPHSSVVALSAHLIACVHHAEQCLATDATRKWTVSRLARTVGCNRTDLERGFKVMLSSTVHEYLTTVRICITKTLLRTTHWKIDAIAREVGYSGKASLYMNFVRAVGMTPQMYRERWLPHPVEDGFIQRLRHLSH